MKSNKESQLQQQCVYWFRVQYQQYAMLLTHPINEGSDHTSQDRRRQAIHKAEGTVAGVPDLLLFMPAVYDGTTSFGLGIEMKTPTGRQSQEQKDYQQMFESAGYRYVVVRTIEEFKQVVNDWIAHVTPERRRLIASAHVELVKARNQRELDYFKKVIAKK
jgi:hypothetical protein